MPRTTNSETLDSERDYTKTKSYAIFDVLTKIASAVGLVAIGAATLWFQTRTERTHKEQHDREEQERLYLPAFRSVGELEVALDDTAYQLRHLKYRNDIARRDDWYDLGTKLQSTAVSVFLPHEDPTFPIQNPFRRVLGFHSQQPRFEKLQLKAATLMLADILRLPNALGFRYVSDNSRILLPSGGNYLVLRTPDGGELHYPTSRESMVAWRQCLNAEGLNTKQLEAASLRVYAAELRLAAAQFGHDLMRSNAALGDKYVDIRKDIYQQLTSRENAAGQPKWPRERTE